MGCRLTALGVDVNSTCLPFWEDCSSRACLVPRGMLVLLSHLCGHGMHLLHEAVQLSSGPHKTAFFFFPIEMDSDSLENKLQERWELNTDAPGGAGGGADCTNPLQSPGEVQVRCLDHLYTPRPHPPPPVQSPYGMSEQEALGTGCGTFGGSYLRNMETKTKG